MIIKVEGLTLGSVETTVISECDRIAAQFGVMVELPNRTQGPGGLEINLIGTPGAILKALTAPGGWSSGNDEDDGETVYLYLKDATRIYDGK